MLEIHNSLTGKKAEFKSLRPNEVRMYVCGITVYDFIHLGHARMLTVFDLVQRYLRACGFKVTYVRNITDIDDKIIQRAAERGEDWSELARRSAGARPRAARHRLHRAHHRHDAHPDREGVCLRRRERRCDVFGAQVPELRRAVRQENR
jgi:cysteinyl-tRNA synthetase